MKEAAAIRAARGAKWLDKVAPGWHEHVQTEGLDIDRWERCVCGRLEASGFIDTRKLPLLPGAIARYEDDEPSFANCFILDWKRYGFFVQDLHKEEPELNDAWVREIERRRQ